MTGAAIYDHPFVTGNIFEHYSLQYTMLQHLVENTIKCRLSAMALEDVNRFRERRQKEPLSLYFANWKYELP